MSFTLDGEQKHDGLQLRSDTPALSRKIGAGSDTGQRRGVSGSSCNAAAGVIAESQVGRAAKGWAVATLTESDHDKALAESWWALSARHPDIVLQQQHLTHDWIADPYSRGSRLSSAPGQVRGLHQLTDMPPPVFFAGGDFSRGWYGWMEGAVTSGRDAATRALACTDDGSAPPAMG